MLLREDQIQQARNQAPKKQPQQTTPFISIKPTKKNVYVGPGAPTIIQQYTQEQKTPPVTLTQSETQRNIRQQTINERFQNIRTTTNQFHQNPNSPFQQQQNLNVARSQIMNVQPGGSKYNPDYTYSYTLGGKTASAQEVLNYIDTQKNNVSNQERSITRSRLSSGKQIGSLSQYSKEVGEYPPGTTFTTHAGVTTVNIPESAQLEFNKYYIREAKKKGWLGEIELFGQGVASDVLSLGAPVAGFIGKRKEYEAVSNIMFARGSTVNPFDVKESARIAVGGAKASRYGIHYVSPLDVGFERIGWSPKGSTKVLGEGGLAFQAGGITGEAVQWVGFTGVLKGGTSVARGLIGGTKKIPLLAPIGTKPLFQAGKEILTKVSSSPTIRKFSESSLAKNVSIGLTKVPSRSLTIIRGIGTTVDYWGKTGQIIRQAGGFVQVPKFLPVRASKNYLGATTRTGTRTSTEVDLGSFREGTIGYERTSLSIRNELMRKSLLQREYVPKDVYFGKTSSFTSDIKLGVTPEINVQGGFSSVGKPKGLLFKKYNVETVGLGIDYGVIAKDIGSHFKPTVVPRTVGYSGSRLPFTYIKTTEIDTSLEKSINRLHKEKPAGIFYEPKNKIIEVDNTLNKSIEQLHKETPGGIPPGQKFNKNFISTEYPKKIIPSSKWQPIEGYQATGEKITGKIQDIKSKFDLKGKTRYQQLNFPGEEDVQGFDVLRSKKWKPVVGEQKPFGFYTKLTYNKYFENITALKVNVKPKFKLASNTYKGGAKVIGTTGSGLIEVAPLRTKGLQYLESEYVPVSRLFPEKLSGRVSVLKESSVLGVRSSKIVSGSDVQGKQRFNVSGYKVNVKPKQREAIGFKSELFTGSKNIQGLNTIHGRTSINKSTYIQGVHSLQIQDQQQIQIMKQKQTQAQKQNQSYKTTTPTIPVIWFPKTDLYGRGIREYGYKQPSDLEYKFRKANIKLPFSDLKTPRFKI